jgi:hypothetical protein
MALTVSSLTTEYVRVQVAVKDSGEFVDPTSDLVQMAFPLPGVEPSGGDWQAASWESDVGTTPPSYFARCLVGPLGTVILADGTYDVWVKITDTPEIPVRKVGALVVT